MVAVKSLNQFSYLSQKVGALYPTAVGTLFCLLSMEMPSLAVLAQKTNDFSTARVSGDLPKNNRPNYLLIAQAGIIGSDNFNPGLQSPLPQTEDVKIKPQTPPLIPSSPPVNLTTPQQTKPLSPNKEASAVYSNFNPGLALPPPTTEIIPPPSKPPQPKPASPPPELVVPGQARLKPVPTTTWQTNVNTPGRSRLNGSWPQPSSSSQASQLNSPQPSLSNQTAQSSPSKPSESPPISIKPQLSKGVVIVLESVIPNFHNTRNESGQINQTAETTANFLLENGNRIKLVTGYNTFIKPGFATVNNVPINLSWETNIDSVKIEPSIGVNLFDRLTSSPTYGLKVAIPIASGLTLSGSVESGAYKFNTETIQNQISAVRYGPGISWKIDQDTSFLAIYKFGNYSDGNTENQLFSRLERKSGQFWVAANLFSWGYGKNIGSASGYFSPPDFLAYSGEIGVEGTVLFDSLTCRLSIQVGNQQASGATTIGQAFQGLCKTKLSPSLEANFGYGFGNSRKDFSSEETGNTNTITGGLIYKF